MGSFSNKAKARQAKEFFNLTEGREKTTVDDIMIDYPEGITITGCSMTKTKKGDDVAVLTFKEDDKVFFFGGQVFTDLVKDWASDYNDDYKATTEALQAEGGCFLKVIKKKSEKTGNIYVSYEMQ